jgi:signal transduction histidine kinase
MNPLRSLLAFEKAYSHDKKSKSRILNFINSFLMVFVLFVILIGLNDKPLFNYSISDDVLFLLFLIYLFLNFVSFLIRKELLCSATCALIVLLLFVFFKANLCLGIDFYVVNTMYPFIILMGTILINSKFSFYICLLISLISITIFILQINGYVTIDFSWKMSWPNFLNVLIILISCLLITLVSWYIFKEFEIKTKKLKKSQLDKLINLAPLLNLGKLTRELIHEIRNNLSVISIVLQNAQINKNIIHDLDLAIEAVYKIDKLSSLACYQLFEEAQLEVFDLNLEINNLINLFKDKLKNKKIKIIFQSNKNYQLYADRMKLDLILNSLIMNAIESNVKSNDKNIFIKLVKKPRNLLIKVKDYGIGIDKINLSSVFTPYFSSKDKAKFLGLGLYASQQAMIKAYETKIKVESFLNIGSIFTLYIKKKFLLI